MKRYPVYKDSGVEWISEIPKNWDILPLKRGIEFLTDFEANGSFATIKENVHVDLGEPYAWYVRATDLENRRFGLKGDNRFCDKKTWDFLAKTQLSGGELLATKRGEIGKVYLMPNVDVPATLGPNLYLIRLNGNLSPKFAHYWFLCDLGKSQLQLADKSTTIGAIYKDDIKACGCSFPPIKEQQAIVKYLDHRIQLIETLIEKKQKQIELLQEQRAATINQAVTKGLNPNVRMKDSGIEWLGDVPEHWRLSKLKYVAKVFRGRFSHRPRNDPAFYDGPFPFIQTGDVAKAGKFITSYSQTLNEKGFEVSKEFPKGTLVMTIAANIGDIAILDFDACFPDSIVGFYPAEGVILDYLFYLLGVMKDEFYKLSTINTQLNINVDRISFCVCPLPPVDEQKSIARKLDDKMEKIDLLQSKHQLKIKNLQEYRTTLISDVVTGKIDVRDEAIPA